MGDNKSASQDEFDQFIINKSYDISNSTPTTQAQANIPGEFASNPPLAFNGKDKIFVLIAFVLGFLLFDFVLFEGFGIGVPAFTALFYTAAFWYLSGRPSGINKRSLWLLVPIVLLCACFALYDNPFLNGLDFLLLYALVTLQLATMTGNRLYGISLPGLIIDFFNAGVALPLANIPAPFQALRRKPSSGGRIGRAAAVCIGLAISLPVLAVVLALLAGADPVFESGLSDILSFISRHIADYVQKVILGAIAAMPIFGLLYALRVNKKIKSLKVRIDPDKVKLLNSGIAATVLIVLCAAYLAFVAVQFGYLFNAFTSILPAAFTYAGYARRGFFELMGVSVINMGVLAVSMLFSRRVGTGATLIKALETLLIALTLLMVASAFAKMAMYMDAYGLTLPRVYASWFLLLLTVFFIAMLVKQYVRKFALTRFCGAAFLVLFLALNFADADARIAQYDIDGYRAAKFRTVDVDMFYNLSDSMIPYASKLMDSPDQAVANKARKLFAARSRIVGDGRWQVFSRAWENARQTLIAEGFGNPEN
jgi:hypothetical protein